MPCAAPSPDPEARFYDRRYVYRLYTRGPGPLSTAAGSDNQSGSGSRHRKLENVATWIIARSPIASPTSADTARSSRSRPKLIRYLEAGAIQRRVFATRRSGPLLRQRQGDAVPDARQPLRYDRPHPIPLPRHAGGRPPTRRDQGESAGISSKTPGRSEDSPARHSTCSPVTGSDRGQSWRIRTTIGIAARSSKAGRTTAGRSSRSHRSTPKTRTGPASASRIWGCIASNSRATSMKPDREVGLHYQIHRGIGVHHASAIRRGRAVEGQRDRRRAAEPWRSRR